MKKILFFLPTLMGGGAERICVTIMNHLDREKYSIVLLLIDQPEQGFKKDVYHRYLREDIQVVNLGIPINKSRYFKIFTKMVKELYRIQPDLIFSTMFKSNLLISVVSLCYVKKKKVVFRAANNQSAIARSWISRRAIGWMYRRVAKRVIAISDGVKADLIENFRVDGDKIQTIHNPVDLGFISESIGGPVEGWVPDSARIISVGRLVEQKDYPTLIKALSLVKDEGVAFHCRILGSGEMEAQIRELIEGFGLSGQVQLEGFKENPYKYMHSADIFVLHSRWEGFGNVVLEAMASGTPVIASRCRYGPQEIIGEHFGELFEVGDVISLKDKLVELIGNQERRAHLSRLGHERVKDFSVERAIRDYECVFDSGMVNR